MSLTVATLKPGDKCNWKGQPERLVFLGKRRHAGDNRTWFQFAKVETPNHVWCEVLEADLPMLEKTQ